MSTDIGEKIRELRVRAGLTQEELADRSELSKGFISQLERNLTSPSIATLEDILQCLGVTAAELFAEDKDEQIVFGPEDFFEKVNEEEGSTVTWIVPNAQKNAMEPILLTLDKGGSTYVDDPHEGEEFGFVLRGKIEIHMGRRVHTAKEGESFYFRSDKTHFITSKNGAELIWISNPPSF